jgi:hypothetical protein
VAHLGDRVAALVDGQLPADAVERAHSHLVGCRPCREAVEAERLMKARLASLRGPEPGVDLIQRLLSMGGPNGPLPPRVGHVPGTPRPPAVALPRAAVIPALPAAEAPVLVNALVPIGSADAGPIGAGSMDAAGGLGAGPIGAGPIGAGPVDAGQAGAGATDRPSGRRAERQLMRAGSTGPGRAPSRRRTRLAVAAVFGALSVVGVGLGGLANGTSAVSPTAPTVVPPVDSFVVDHVRTTADLPFIDGSAGWQLTSAERVGGAGR